MSNDEYNYLVRQIYDFPTTISESEYRDLKTRIENELVIVFDKIIAKRKQREASYENEYSEELQTISLQDEIHNLLNYETNLQIMKCELLNYFEEVIFDCNVKIGFNWLTNSTNSTNSTNTQNEKTKKSPPPSPKRSEKLRKRFTCTKV
jgi:hypothetical protein